MAKAPSASETQGTLPEVRARMRDHTSWGVDGRRAGTIVTMPTADSSVLAGNQSVNLPDHDIAHRAFELYCARGCQHGHDIDDWLQAERELRDSVRLHVA
jgi:Protein of unknown function (DUF2934)